MTGTPGAPTPLPSLGPSVGPTTTPTVTATLPPPSLAALQQVLAGEHAVIWAYGTLGPHLDEASEERALALVASHSRTREQVRAQILGAGGQPVEAEPAYELPITPVDPTTAASLAGLVEARLAAVYADLVAAADAAGLRTQGVNGLVDSTLLATSWGTAAPAFPGLPERTTPTSG